MIEINRMLREQFRSLDAATYKKFLCSEVIRNWREFVDESFADKIKPVKIEHGILFVEVESSALKDQLKFFAEEIIDAINENFGREEPLVKEIKIAKGFQISDAPLDKKIPAQIEEPPIKPEEIILTEEEIKLCEAQTKKIPDETLRQTVLKALLSQAKIQKSRLTKDWHKCAKCNALCPPEEIFCEVCRIKERDAMTKELFKIFHDKPHLKTQDVQKLLLKKMPHANCPSDVIDSARTSLIQNLASRIRFGDEKSPEVLKLVMLEKRLPPEKITPAIIKRTLSDLYFNLSSLPKFPRKF